MIRLVVAVLALAGVLAVSPVVAGAGPTKALSYALEGSSVWNTTFLPTSFAATGDVRDGTRTVGSYSGTLTAGTWGPCAEPNNPYGPWCADVTGDTITFSLHGGTLTTAVTGGTVWQFAGPASHDTYVFEITLSVTSGTHAYASAAGTFSLHYETSRDNFARDPITDNPCVSVDVSKCPISDIGTLTGTISR